MMDIHEVFDLVDKTKIEDYGSLIQTIKDEDILGEYDELIQTLEKQYEEYLAFNTRDVRCLQCGKKLHYGECHEIEYKEYAGESEKTISSGFPTGVVVKQVRRKHRLYKAYLCEGCYALGLKQRKKAKKRSVLLWVLGVVAFVGVGILAYFGIIPESFLLVLIIPVLLFIIELMRR